MGTAESRYDPHFNMLRDVNGQRASGPCPSIAPEPQKEAESERESEKRNIYPVRTTEK